jgi:polyhydroxyalkanoate synthesis regulator phasin
MGELKQLSESQQGLLDRVKSLGQQVYLANLGLVSKVEEEGKKQYDRIVAAGGEQSNKAAVVVNGLVEVLKVEADKLRADGLKAQVETLKQRFTGLNLKEEGQKLFDDLVAAGEKRKAA